MAKVAITRCTEYEHNQLYDAVLEGINLLGGIECFVRQRERILLKPNILFGDNPAKCTTTHPLIVQVTAEIVRSCTDNIVYGDSPGPGMTAINAKSGGYTKYAEKAGISLVDFKEAVDVVYDDALQNRHFTIARAVHEADGLISLCKMKTHGFTRITGAIKNQFGCVPGLRKGEYHVKLSNVFDFSRMLVDLNNYIKPRLYIMDAVWAMEGNGPRSGTPYHMGLILVSADPIALDATFCRIIGMDPEIVPTNTAGMEAGAGTWKSSEIEILGIPLKECMVSDFKAERSPVTAMKRGRFFALANRMLVPKPKIEASKCIRCGTCVRMCPTMPKSLNWKDRSIPPVYNYSSCIRCFCCQEICPEDAIHQHKPLLRRMLDGKKQTKH
ncbi:MAG: DUF362 domain-containing protein [Spirochaetales bacterium]|nr:DUF362 domain-containing protein [Spirochaetales bacterium]